HPAKGSIAPEQTAALAEPEMSQRLGQLRPVGLPSKFLLETMACEAVHRGALVQRLKRIPTRGPIGSRVKLGLECREWSISRLVELAQQRQLAPCPSQQGWPNVL